jgi:hypothetical protein
MITSERRGDDQYLQLSNGSTSVLLAVLLLSGSELATSTWEQELMTWLAEHDHGVFGSGMVGFDLDEIAWDAMHFEARQRFVLRVIDLAAQRHRWDELGYEPPFVAAHLSTLRALVADYRPDPHATADDWSWMSPPQRLVKCDRHRVYVHDHGCLLCNDGV